MKKVFALVLAVAMMAAMLAGCNNGAADPTTGDSTAVKIGLTGPFTGNLAAYGEAVQAGMEIAVEEINAEAEKNGGLKIEFQAYDDEGDADKSVNGYNKLKDWGMQLFAGAVTTDPCNAIAPEAVADQIVMITPSGSAESIALAGSNVYQMCFTDPNQGASAAELIYNKLRSSKIGIIYDSSDAYSSGICDGFKEKATELGLSVVKETSFTSDNNTDLSSQVTECKNAGADLVFLPIYYTEATRILNAADTIGYDPIFFGCDGMDGILTVEGFNKELAEGLVLMTPFDANATDDATVSFVTKYKEKMNGLVPNQFAADGYDVIQALYKACVAAGVDGNTPVAEACEKVTAQLNEMTYDGLTGKGMQWDENGMISKDPAAVVIDNEIYVPMV